ncbi:DUF4116 domain-containing protein, partial [Roseibium sp. RKSG952]|uniref:DUF4116 domain-containing protein n=1 Tax=Roseibium sp. RKSG952 TaxID=2529384 RepID=UPI0034CE51EA
MCRGPSRRRRCASRSPDARDLPRGEQNGWALRYMPSPLRSPEMCLEAVRQHGIALKDVPEPLQTEEVCLEAEALMYVPDDLRTEEMCFEAV